MYRKRHEIDFNMSERTQKTLGALVFTSGLAFAWIIFGGQKDNSSARWRPDTSTQVEATHPETPSQRPQSITENLTFKEPDRSPGAWQSVLATSQGTPKVDDVSNQPTVLISAEEQETATTLLTSVSELEMPTLETPSLEMPSKKFADESQLELTVQEEVARQLKMHALEQKSSDDALSSSVSQTSFESTIPAPVALPDLAPSIEVEKRVRKVNWREIEMSPVTAPMTSFRPKQQPVLQRQRANPLAESRAREHIQYGESLARRRAFFAAREEFIRALLLISNSYSSNANSGSYPERFAQALIAIDEAGDFATLGNQPNSGLLLQQKILSHKSNLLTREDIETTTPQKAIGIYIRFSQAQIEQAIGHSAAGSEALHALGKLESLAPEANAELDITRQARALVFLRAGINVDPSNSVCVNDLGVLLFKMGRLHEAETALKDSIRLSPSQLSWNNLASIYSHLAAAEDSQQQRNHLLSLANMAAGKAMALTSDPRSTPFGDNQWASASEFQNNAAFPDVVVQQQPSDVAETAPSQNNKRSSSLMKKVKGWF
jgi:tetratricopeptide (TPR) repeat protein